MREDGASGETILKRDLLENNFKDFVAAHRDEVYNSIIAYLQPAGATDRFREMLRSYTDRRGQYRRPGYMMAWAHLYGADLATAVLPAAAQQLSEDYLLMHDDWMDNNSIRRGLPAAHILYGPEYAIDAGDTLQAILWKMVWDASRSLSKRTGTRYYEKFYDMILTTHIGQYLDLALTREVSDVAKFTIEDYYASIHAKSAYYSVYGPMQCGAIIAGKADREVAKIKNYGEPAGLAFQIKDDILDCIATEAELGKSIGNDVREGTKTIILWHAIHNSDSSTMNRIREIYMLPRKSKSDSDVAFVLGKFTELGSIAFAEKEAESFSEKAAREFDRAAAKMPDGPAKEIARSGIVHTTHRKK